MEIKNAKVIITGGTSGIGYETAKLLRSHGAQIVICGRTETTLQAAAKALDVIGFRADMAVEADIEALIAFGIKTMGGLNVLINNAGFGLMAPLVDTTTDAFSKVWETNVKGLFIAGRAAARHFVQEGTGNIINIGSTAALRGFATGSAYVASKFAVSGLTECWRAELRKHNVRVMQVNPSEVVTDFAVKLGHEYKNTASKLHGTEIAHTMLAMLSMGDVGFIPEASVWATNPQ